MPVIVPIEKSLWLAYKETRLKALLDAPLAFGSTHAAEILLSDDDWLRRSASCDGIGRVAFLAIEESAPCGLIGSVIDEADPSKADVVSMWVAPSHRRSGLGSALLESVRNWALSRQAATLRLSVTSNNDAAIAFYERCGFRKTGRIEPYPNDPALMEFEMVRPTI